MPYCTHCGSSLSDSARFCSSCGSAVTAPSPPAAAAEPLDYEIHGDNLQIVRVRLRPGQQIYAEAGKMVYKSASIAWESRLSGRSLGDKLIGALKRKLTGESLFMTYFRATTAGEVGFAGNYPGRIQVFRLGPGQSVLVQRDGFLFAEASVQLGIALVRKLGAGLFGGEGFVLQRLTGPGCVFVHAGGDQLEFELKAGETLQVDTGCVVAFDESVTYDIEMAGGIKTALFGGEGLFLTTLTGPGRVVIQSMTLEKLRRELGPFQSGGDERSGLGAVGGLLASEDR